VFFYFNEISNLTFSPTFCGSYLKNFFTLSKYKTFLLNKFFWKFKKGFFKVSVAIFYSLLFWNIFVVAADAAAAIVVVVTINGKKWSIFAVVLQLLLLIKLLLLLLLLLQQTDYISDLFLLSVFLVLLLLLPLLLLQLLLLLQTKTIYSCLRVIFMEKSDWRISSVEDFFAKILFFFSFCSSENFEQLSQAVMQYFRATGVPNHIKLTIYHICQVMLIVLL